MMSSIFVILVGGLLASAPEVELETLAGETYAGQLVELDDERALLATDDGEQSLSLADVLHLVPRSASSHKADPSVWVELIDGSTVVCTEYEAAQGTARVTLLQGSVLEVPTSAIGVVRFHKSSAATAAQWQRILERNIAGDLVVVRKDDTIDFLEGLLSEVTPETVQFELDGELLPVKRTKLEGVVYYHSPAELPEAIGRVHLAGGSVLPAQSLLLKDDSLHIVTPAGVAIDAPSSDLSRLDFSRGKVVYLSDLEWDARRSGWTPYFGRSDQLPALAAFYQPQRDRSFGGEPLRLDNKVYGKGLSLRSRTELTYRLPDAFRRFIATVGIDDSVGEAGHVQLIIRGDGQPLFDGVVTGRDPPRPLQLDIDGVRELQIVVDYGEDLDVADYLNLCEAKVIK